MSDIDLSKLPNPIYVVTQQLPPEKKTDKSWLGWLRDIGIIGIVSAAFAALVTTYFQYKRWDVEQRLAKSQAEFQSASQTFASVSANIARAQALQEILFFIYRDASANPPPDKAAFLTARARETYPLYEAARVELRQKIDTYLFDTRQHLDWASDIQVPGVIALGGVDPDPLSSGELKSASDFSCLEERSMPQSMDHKMFERSSYKTFQIDWNSSTHHLIIFVHCFRAIHDQMEPARIWAGNLVEASRQPAAPGNGTNGSPTLAKPVLGNNEAQVLIHQLNNQIQRLNGFSALGMTQVARTRRQNAPPGFFTFIQPSWL